MKKISEILNGSQINESTGDKFNEHIKSHAEAYNRLLKWYDKAINHMNADEAIDLLKYAIDQWSHGNFDDI